MAGMKTPLARVGPAAFLMGRASSGTNILMPLHWPEPGVVDLVVIDYFCVY
jgi:hypothetical protein